MTLARLQLVRSDMAFESDGTGRGLLRSRRRPRRAARPARPLHHGAALGGTRAGGKLDLRLSASVDGRRVLQGLVPDVEHASGHLPRAGDRGRHGEAAHRAGQPAHRGRRGDACAACRSPRARLNGSISFSQDALVIDSMAGKLNNGEAPRLRRHGARHRGRRTSTSPSPRQRRATSRLDIVGRPLDGDLTLFGPPREPVLGGSITVSQLKYTEDLDLERSLLDFSRRPPAPRVLTKSAMLVHFDLDVHLGRGVRVENNLARTDLEGRPQASPAPRAPSGLLGSVNTVHGTASFRGNEFADRAGRAHLHRPPAHPARASTSRPTRR